MQVIIKEVNSPGEFKIFYQFQNKLYRNCKEYVPTMDLDQKSTLENDPALEYCTRKLWLAYMDGRAVGRIQAIVNPRYNEYYNLKRLRFGWFDFEDNIDIARELFNTAVEWGRTQGMTEIHGPLAYNTLGRQGMLIEGFENVPPSNCLYNFSYYPQAMEKLGFSKEADWVQYKLNASQGAPEKLNRISDILLKRYKLRLLDIKTIKGEQKEKLIENFFKIYNECFTAVHNFIPLTKAEIEKTGKTYFKLLKSDLTCLVVDENEEVAAFGLCFPSLSVALQKSGGKLLPFGWFHFLRAFNKYDTIDLMMVGSNPIWASKGLSAIYHAHLAASFRKNNIQHAITNPQIDTNIAAIKVWESYDHEAYMRRRCWIKSI
ncbi:MAG: hypothetical protein RSA75_07090 [Bacteroidales bacterium]